MTIHAAKDPAEYPILRNLQFSPIKQGDDQLIVLWDPSGLSKEKLVLPLNFFFIVQHFDGEHSIQDIGALYLKRFGEFLLPSKVEQLVVDLEQKLFLEGLEPTRRGNGLGSNIGSKRCDRQCLPDGATRRMAPS